MSVFAGFDAEAQKMMLALEYGAKVRWSDAFAAAKELVTNPTAAVADGSAETVLVNAADIAKAIGVLIPPVAIVANDLSVAAELEPIVVAGLGLILASGGTGTNGQPGTSSLQDDLEDRFEAGKSR